MSHGCLVVRSVGKAYRSYSSEWHRIGAWLGLRLRPPREHWVLRDVSFEIEPGQAVGVIGPNGAGKSTLLKLITGTLAPTTGTIDKAGRVAAILELGMGFNPEFSGRLNAVHSAGLMGHSRREIDRVLPEIEAFAEVGEYFDQPVRTYSSGMHVRVAFAVATAFRPDLLIIDEALSVGDAYFQHKSFERIRELVEQGTTLLFVSHDPGAIRKLCDTAILIDGGTVAMQGHPEQVVDYYNALLSAKEEARLGLSQKRREDGWLQTESGTKEATVAQIGLYAQGSDAPLHWASVGQQVVIRASVAVHRPIARLVLGLMIRDRTGHVVWGTNTHHTGQVLVDPPVGSTVEYAYAFEMAIGPGAYSISPALVSSDTHLQDNYQWVDNMLVFEVVNTQHDYFGGTTWLKGRFEIRQESHVDP